MIVNRKKLIFGLCFVVIMIIPISFAVHQLVSLPLTADASAETPLATLDWTDYRCDDFEDAPNRIYAQMDDFYFLTLHYGIYLGVMFMSANEANATLLIYAFLLTLTDSFLQSLSTTFSFSLNFTYRTTFVQTSGVVVDSAPFMTTSNCLCQYPLYSKNFSKGDPSLFSINIDYGLISSEFAESGSFSASKTLNTSTSIPIPPYFIIIGLSLAIFINLMIKRRKLD